LFESQSVKSRAISIKNYSLADCLGFWGFGVLGFWGYFSENRGAVAGFGFIVLVLLAAPGQ